MFEQILSSVLLLAKQRTEPASQAVRPQVPKSKHSDWRESNEIPSRRTERGDGQEYFCDRDQGWKPDSSSALDNLKVLAARQNYSQRQARENWLRSSGKKLILTLACSDSTTSAVDPEAREQAINELLHMAYDHQ